MRFLFTFADKNTNILKTDETNYCHSHGNRHQPGSNFLHGAYLENSPLTLAGKGVFS